MEGYVITAGGDNWERAFNWLQGEPCVDGWEGVYCCPDSHPYLASWTKTDDEDTVLGGCQSSVEALVAGESTLGYTHSLRALQEGPQLLDVAEVYPVGCASGNSTGVAEHDEARCVVVALDLEANGLAGTLTDVEVDFVLASLPHLRVLLLAGFDVPDVAVGVDVGDDHVHVQAIG